MFNNSIMMGWRLHIALLGRGPVCLILESIIYVHLRILNCPFEFHFARSCP